MPRNEVKKLTYVELYAVQCAQRDMDVAKARLDKVVLACGLTPGTPYEIEDDGVVYLTET